MAMYKQTTTKHNNAWILNPVHIVTDDYDKP